MNYYCNKTALITGASSGIGAEFARALARRGSNLILVARSQDKLRALATELTDKHGVAARVIARDLSEENSARQVAGEVEKLGLNVEILVNNAGFGSQGDLETIDPARDHAQTMLNVVAVVDLTHAFLPAMVARGSGAIINVASTAGFVPLPGQAVYGASKAFVLSFSEALWAENRERGVRVVALCPGATDTPFFEAVGKEITAPKATPQFVVRAALAGLSRGDSFVVPGRNNWIVADVLPRLLPRMLLAKLAARVGKDFWKQPGN